MTMFAMPMGPDGGVDDELLALAKLEATSNAIRLRIAGMTPDQLYRGSLDELTIAELIADAVDREKAYLDGFRRVRSETNPRLNEPRPGLAFMDRGFAEDLALFFDLRRETLDLLRSFNDDDWERKVTLPNGSIVSVEELALRLQRYDAHMLKAISAQKQKFKQTTGINQLRDAGVAGKLGENIGQ
ncbi:MAG: DinB family protein [Chloroflexota bacterium]|nr:DinB family protein [Chloroflexota bacterium]PLS79335.1 MAG: hypothetical protein CYG59_13705 [Chloroflexota bacterium]